jgi:hypothetical protein
MHGSTYKRLAPTPRPKIMSALRYAPQVARFLPRVHERFAAANQQYHWSATQYLLRARSATRGRTRRVSSWPASGGARSSRGRTRRRRKAGVRDARRARERRWAVDAATPREVTHGRPSRREKRAGAWKHTAAPSWQAA